MVMSIGNHIDTVMEDCPLIECPAPKFVFWKTITLGLQSQLQKEASKEKQDTQDRRAERWVQGIRYRLCVLGQRGVKVEKQKNNNVHTSLELTPHLW